MKTIKLFENFEEYYTEMDNETVNKFLVVDVNLLTFTQKEINQINILLKLLPQIPKPMRFTTFDSNICRIQHKSNNKTCIIGAFNNNINIYKLHDEWFIIRLLHYLTKENAKYFKCDQMSGVENFINTKLKEIFLNISEHK